MKKDDVKHLATLARLKLTDEELERFAKEFGDILGYIDKLKEVNIDLDDVSGRIESAGVRNVMRSDDDVQETGMYTDDILKEAPDTEDGYVKVKKILASSPE